MTMSLLSSPLQSCVGAESGQRANMRALVLSLILTSSSASVAAGQGEGDEWDLALCEGRGNHWRNNQHNYLYSGLLGQVESPHWFSLYIYQGTS